MTQFQSMLARESLLIAGLQVCALIAAASANAAPAIASVALQAPTSCQPNWVPTFGPPPGLDSTASSVLVYDDGSGPVLYVGGGFTYAGGVQANHIAKWDGSRWSSLGAGVTGPIAQTNVTAMVVFDDGTGPALYIGGNFSAAGGLPANNIAKWNGQNWSNVGGGVTGTHAGVGALAEFNDGSGRALYATGSFATAGGIAANNIAKWNGSQWSPLGSGIGALNESARSLCVYNDGTGPELYAGGYFTLAGSVASNRIAKWNGSTWSSVGGGMDGQLLTMRVFNDGSGSALYAAGNFTTAGGVSATSIAKWNGTNWSPLGSGLAGYVTSLTPYNDGTGLALHASTYTVVAGALVPWVSKWNGSSWSTLGSGTQAFVNPAEILALAVFDDGTGTALFAAGWFATADGITVDNIAKWSGSTWTPLPHGLNGPIEAMVEFDDGSGPALYVGGFFSKFGSFATNRIAKWNGAQWSNLGGGIGHQTYEYVSALAVFDDGSGPALYAAGYFAWAGGVAVHNIAKWNGSNWSALSSAITGPVFAMRTFDDGSGPALYVGGSFTNAGAYPVQSIAKWDGTQWLPVGLWASPYPTVYAFEVFDDGTGPALFAGGSFQNVGSVVADNIAKWNGFSWTTVGGGVFNNMYVNGVNNTVSALEVFDDGSGPGLFAGGTFINASGTPANRIAKWDGSTWSSLATGVTAPQFTPPARVAALRVFDGGGAPQLYAGGSFAMAGGSPASNIAKWNGSSWSSVGAGTDDTVLSLSVFDDSSGPALFAGGPFHRAYDSGDWHLAKWGCPFLSSGATYCTSGTSSNGCMPAISGSGNASASAGSGFSISVANVEGQRTGLLFYGIHGQLAAPWGMNSSSYLCVKSPAQRMSPLNSGGTNAVCDGVLSEDWNLFIATHASALGQPFLGGETVWAQGWFRDSPSAKTTALSNGLVFAVAP